MAAMSVCGRLLSSGMSGFACKWGRVACPKVLLTWSGSSPMATASSKFHASSTIGSSYGYWEPGQFQPKKAVILTKVSRWEGNLVLSVMKPPGHQV